MIIDYQALCAVYEELRSYVLGDISTFSRPPGLDLFLKAGFLNWAKMQAGEEVWRKPPNVGKVKGPELYEQGREQEITLILANMILEERSKQPCIPPVGAS